jgi:hypothetical protein
MKVSAKISRLLGQQENSIGEVKVGSILGVYVETAGSVYLEIEVTSKVGIIIQGVVKDCNVEGNPKWLKISEQYKRGVTRFTILKETISVTT